jgi:hypothetical protein
MSALLFLCLPLHLSNRNLTAKSVSRTGARSIFVFFYIHLHFRLAAGWHFTFSLLPYSATVQLSTINDPLQKKKGMGRALFPSTRLFLFSLNIKLRKKFLSCPKN